MPERSILKEAHVVDMTEGNPLKQLLTFSIPIFIGSLFQQVYNVVDTMVAGYCLGDNAIAAIGATGSLYALLINLAMGMNAGFAVVVTLAFGAKNQRKLRNSIAGMVELNLVICAVLTALSLILLDPFLQLLSIPPAIYEDAKSYIFFIFAGMVAMVLYNMFASILRSVGNSLTPLLFLIFSSCLNVGLDLLFVAYMHMGVAGAAVATVTSQAVSAVISGVYLVRNYQEILPEREDFQYGSSLLVELLSSGVAMALMYAVINIGGVIVQRAINSLGEIAVSAEVAANKVTDLCMTVFGAVSTAAATFIGQNWGAGRKDRVKTCLRIAVGITTAWSLLCLGMELLAGPQILQLITGSSNEELLEYALLNNRLQFTFFFVVGALVVMRTGLQAMGHKTAPILSSITELTVTVINALFFVPRFGYVAQCIGKPTGWILMTIVIFTIYFVKRKKIYADGGSDF